jgi:hypothetical protein
MTRLHCLSILPLLAGCTTIHPGPALPSSFASADKSPTTNSFGIYLIAEPIDPGSVSTNLSEIKLKSPPVISDADIVAVYLRRGIMHVRPGVFKRLPAPSVLGTHFVAVADGQPVFMGAFWTGSSSFTPDVNATISLDCGPDYLSLGWFDPGTHRGDSGWWLGKEEAAGDLWSQPRIKQCLGKLHKLGKVEPL